MIIDKSHSKKDLINLFTKLGVIIDDELTKGRIVSNVDKYIENVIYNDKIKNCTELKEHLKNPSKKQRPTRQKKKDIMFNAKKIIKWAKNNYIFDSEPYENQNDPYDDIMKIYMWGDLPSVRRACRFYNLSVYCKNHINPIISEEIEEEINQNKIIKKQYIYNLQVKHKTKQNPFIISFD
tara:strand:- start:5 stop:544 length:540 start_codon:yes stop_codon:yes gene_type:complete